MGPLDLGADETFDYASDSLAADVLAATDGDGVDVVTTGGQAVTIVGDRPATSGAPLRDEEVTLRGINLGNRSYCRSTLDRIARLVDRDELTAVVAGTYDIAEIRAAHRDVVEGDHLGDLVVTLSFARYPPAVTRYCVRRRW